MITRIQYEIAELLFRLQAWVRPRGTGDKQCKLWKGHTYWSKKYNKEKTLQCVGRANKSGYCRGHDVLKSSP